MQLRQIKLLNLLIKCGKKFLKLGGRFHSVLSLGIPKEIYPCVINKNNLSYCFQHEYCIGNSTGAGVS